MYEKLLWFTAHGGTLKQATAITAGGLHIWFGRAPCVAKSCPMALCRYKPHCSLLHD